ncbi:LTA synthase family protein [Halobacillus sp. SY10]|uniref:LTA synthase family protein n=1 Tax=Halobacillus sp. SY10 TaxID=3381356 RepID=UPI00387A4775
MVSHFSKGIPILLISFIFYSSLYGLVGGVVSGNFNAVIDWAQIHTGALSMLVLLLTLATWTGVVYYLHKKEWMQVLYESKIYKIFTSLIMSVYVGLVSAFLFIAYHLGIDQIGKTTEWFQQYPDRFLFTAFLLSLITFAFILLIGEAYIASTLSLIVFYLVALANYYKKEFRNEPLFPYDFVQIGQLTEVLPMISGAFSLPIILVLTASLILASAVWWKIPKFKLGWKTRVVLVVPIVYLVFSFFNYEGRFTASYYQEYASIMPWNQQNNYYYNGPVLGMISNLKFDVVEKPDSYSERAVEASMVQADEVFEEKQTKDTEIKPNIIFFMNETFWDPTNLDVQFSEDPLPNIRSLMKENPSGHLFSPSFGGETANVEFEALTSFSMNYINPGGNPFNNLLSNKSYPSFVSFLNKHGYYTEAIHPNGGNLYRRDNVYPNLGFNTSKFIEDMTYTAKDNKQFVSDESVAKELLDTIENEEDPSFIHAVTIANHLPYDADKYEGGSSISVQGEGLSDESKTRLEVYAEGIKRSDQTFQWLYEKIQALDEPTVIVFFGDHLPSLGANLQAYKETGYGDEQDQQTNPDFYQTPLLFLSNYEADINEDVGVMSPIYLGSFLSNELGLKTHPFYDFMQDMKGEIPAFRNQIFLKSNEDSVKSEEELSPSAQEYLEDYHHFQYDVLTGNQHVIDQLYQIE